MAKRRKRFWLINGATHAAAANPRRRRRSGGRKMAKRRGGKSVPAWVRAKGFRTWSAYMASIRPNGGGGRTVAKRNSRRRRRRSTTATRRRRRRNPSTAVVLRAANPRRRRYRRRNPDFSSRAIMERVKGAALGATYVTVGKAVSRLVRDNTVGPDEAGKALGSAIEIATGVALGMMGQTIAGPRAAELLAAGALTGVVESLIKQFQVPIISDALASDGTKYALLKSDGTLAGYVTPRMLNSGGMQGYGARGGSNTRAVRPRTAFERQTGTRIG